MASSAFEHNRARCLEAGADDFLPKPFRHGRLPELLSTGLGLTLVYADASADEGGAPQALQVPRAERLRTMLEAARRGDRERLIEQARDAQELGYVRFAADVRALVEGLSEVERDLIGASEGLRTVMENVRQVAATDASVRPSARSGSVSAR